MQNLYALKAWQETGDDEMRKKIQVAQQHTMAHLEQSGRLFIHLLYTLCEVAQYADMDARQRAAKYIPTEEDLHVSTKIVQNSLVRKTLENKDFSALAKEGQMDSRTDPELIKKLYGRFIATEAYQTYTSQAEPTRAADIKVLGALFNDLLMKDEDFTQYMDDLYLQWQDDRSMMKMLVMSYFNKPDGYDFTHFVEKEKKEYAAELIRTVLEKKNYCLEWITPRLQNWDPKRVAIIDMLLLHMAVCEFLFFPSIPPKVTMNEYIELGKRYSTIHSGQFINGVLDNVLKDLKSKGLLNKTERAGK